MYSFTYTGAFLKDVKRLKRRSTDFQILKTAIESLEKDGRVNASFKPHKLGGNYSDCWECHLMSDWLLIWRRDPHLKEIQLIRTGTHADLF